MDGERLQSGVYYCAARSEDPVSLGIRRPRTVETRRHDPTEGVRPGGHIKAQSSQKNQSGSRHQLPLLEVSADVNVVSTTAKTTLTQVFSNPTNAVITEATHVFPLYDGSTVVSFRAWIGPHTKLQGVVKPKATAQEEFDKAVSRQKVATMLEEHTPEIFETRLGNIPPMTSMRVDIIYITELKPDIGGEGVLLTIPTSIAPRYGKPPSYMRNHNSGNVAKSTGRGMKIRVEVSAPVPIRQLESFTHPVAITMGSSGDVTQTDDIDKLTSSSGTSNGEYDPTKAQANYSSRTAILDRDFVLLILVDGGSLQSPQALLEHSLTHPNNSAMMLSFTPQDLFAKKLSKLPKKVVQEEIIFVADRSGSMCYRDKIDVLRRSLHSFLSKMPEESCRFNICSFGSTSNLLWRKSMPCTQSNIKKAQMFLNNECDADMGGTELMSALKESVESRNIGSKGQTQIVILTDGEVWDHNNTIDYVRKTRKKHGDNVRFFALGIGDEISHQLIEDIGRFGGGFAEVLPTNCTSSWEDARILRMLNGALAPHTWNCQVTLEKRQMEVTDDEEQNSHPENAKFVQAPLRIPAVHTFTRSTAFFLFETPKPAFDTVVLTGTSSNGTKIEESLPIKHVYVPTPAIHHLAAKAILKDFESGCHPDGITNTRAECEKLGVQWSIIGKYTSFVGVDTSNGKENLTRMYKADRLEFDELRKPRLPSHFPSFRGLSLPWHGNDLDKFDSPYDDDNDDDDDDSNSPGEGTSSARRVKRSFCNGMLPAYSSRRKHDDEDDGFGGPGHNDGFGGFGGLSRYTGTGLSSGSSKIASATKDAGTSVNWISNSAFWSFFDEPWWEATEDLDVSQKAPHESFIPQLFSMQTMSGAFDIPTTSLSCLETYKTLLNAFKPSTTKEIKTLVAKHERILELLEQQSEDLERKERILCTVLAVAYIQTYGSEIRSKQSYQRGLQLGRDWLASVLHESSMVESVARSGLHRQLIPLSTLRSRHAVLSHQSKMVKFSGVQFRVSPCNLLSSTDACLPAAVKSSRVELVPGMLRNAPGSRREITGNISPEKVGSFEIPLDAAKCDPLNFQQEIRELNANDCVTFTSVDAPIESMNQLASSTVPLPQFAQASNSSNGDDQMPEPDSSERDAWKSAHTEDHGSLDRTEL